MRNSLGRVRTTVWALVTVVVVGVMTPPARAQVTQPSSDVVGALKPLLDAEPDVRIYQAEA